MWSNRLLPLTWNSEGSEWSNWFTKERNAYRLPSQAGSWSSPVTSVAVGRIGDGGPRRLPRRYSLVTGYSVLCLSVANNTGKLVDVKFGRAKGSMCVTVRNFLAIG